MPGCRLGITAQPRRFTQIDEAAPEDQCKCSRDRPAAMRSSPQCRCRCRWADGGTTRRKSSRGVSCPKWSYEHMLMSHGLPHAYRALVPSLDRSSVRYTRSCGSLCPDGPDETLGHVMHSCNLSLGRMLLGLGASRNRQLALREKADRVRTHMFRISQTRCRRDAFLFEASTQQGTLHRPPPVTGAFRHQRGHSRHDDVF
ncbi:hypothetical protein BV20DRAFT_424576 [Pilatotrama ljubarskyi]|nr:hypothetical protein BV20DRAFT_424576 [Pilatotrama ljubarskyi]